MRPAIAFILSQLSGLTAATAASESHGGCKTRSAELASNRRGRQPPRYHQVVRVRSGSIIGSPQLFEGRSRVDPGRYHLVQHLTVSESSKACSPTYSPTPLSNHRQRLSYPFFKQLQPSNPSTGTAVDIVNALDWNDPYARCSSGTILRRTLLALRISIPMTFPFFPSSRLMSGASSMKPSSGPFEITM